MTRQDFLRSTAAGLFICMQPASGRAAKGDFRLNNSLVLSGGGARGAYEVGALAQMVKDLGVRDGERFPGIDIICGTSIGALIGYFIATAQYRKLFQIWDQISRYEFFQIKTKYRAVIQNQSGVLTRVVEALHLTKGLTTKEKGVLDGEHFSRFVETLIGVHKPILTPFVCTATSLTTQSSALFYAVPSTLNLTDTARNAAFRHALALTVGKRVTVREADGELLSKAIRASATIPILLDPIEIDGPYGKEDYVDGGIADNTPVDIARALSKNIKLILVDPSTEEHNTYNNALQIGLGSFEIAQRRILDSALRAAAAATAYGGPYPVQIEILQPEHELPIHVTDFQNRDAIERIMQIGAHDAQRGFVKYVL